MFSSFGGGYGGGGGAGCGGCSDRGVFAFFSFSLSLTAFSFELFCSLKGEFLFFSYFLPPLLQRMEVALEVAASEVPHFSFFLRPSLFSLR